MTAHSCPLYLDGNALVQGTSIPQGPLNSGQIAQLELDNSWAYESNCVDVCAGNVTGWMDRIYVGWSGFGGFRARGETWARRESV